MTKEDNENRMNGSNGKVGGVRWDGWEDERHEVGKTVEAHR